MDGAFKNDIGSVVRRDGSGPGVDLCGDACWARQHCNTDDDDYRTAEDDGL
jgi:hypothetical protein